VDVATLFDRNHLVEGLVCVEAALRQGAELVHVLCLDATTEGKLFEVGLDQLLLIPLKDVENFFPRLSPLRNERDWPSYTDTLKPFFAGYLLEFFGAESVTMVDSDVYFWGPVEEIGFVMRDQRANLLVIDREYEPPLPAGYYNNGFVAMNEGGLPFLHWWQERCMERCEWMTKGPNGEFGGEGYLDAIRAGTFSGARGVKHPGLNLGPWNARFHEVTASGTGLLVDGQNPLICYHYRGFQDHDQPFDEQAPGPAWAKELLHRPYYEKLRHAAERLERRP
jgi:hypothetical protein